MTADRIPDWILSPIVWEQTFPELAADAEAQAWTDDETGRLIASWTEWIALSCEWLDRHARHLSVYDVDQERDRRRDRLPAATYEASAAARADATP